MRICIVGAGAIGGLLAARLANSGQDITVIARGANHDTIQRSGIQIIEQDGSTTTAKDIKSSDRFQLSKAPDILILALKAHQLASVAPDLQNLWDGDTTIVPVQNGIPWWYFYKEGGEYDGHSLRSLDPDGNLEANIPSEQIVGSIAFPAAIKSAPGIVTHVEGNRMPVGEPDRSRSERSQIIASAFSEAGFRSRVLTDIRSHIWLKAWGNLAFNPISALTRSTLREICGLPATRSLSASIMEESHAIATVLNVKIRLSIEQRIAGAEEVGDHKTSMFQDLDAGQPMEIDPLIGVFMELGLLTNVSTPLIDTLHALISLLDSHSASQVATRTTK